MSRLMGLNIHRPHKYKKKCETYLQYYYFTFILSMSSSWKKRWRPTSFLQRNSDEVILCVSPDRHIPHRTPALQWLRTVAILSSACSNTHTAHAGTHTSSKYSLKLLIIRFLLQTVGSHVFAKPPVRISKGKHTSPHHVKVKVTHD